LKASKGDEYVQRRFEFEKRRVGSVKGTNVYSGGEKAMKNSKGLKRMPEGEQELAGCSVIRSWETLSLIDGRRPAPKSERRRGRCWACRSRACEQSGRHPKAGRVKSSKSGCTLESRSAGLLLLKSER